ncbi:MAG TPA: prenyltransferase/squalene oxidase repeat-containing protein, partial [Solirubrobacterales bacterium]|nr:prenyltransferase/squalene oxidase repeat-containing protein [Solirubrobacterales bacterium]
LLAMVVSAALVATPPARADAGDGRSWLVAAQNADGGFPATPGQPSSAAMTTWAMLGLEAAGVNPLDVTEGGKSPVDYLRRSRITSATDLERTIIALEGAGLNTRSFEGRDLVAQLRSRRSGDGSWDGQVNITAFGILALRAAGQGDVARSAAWLRNAQNSNGGWGFAPGRGSEADSTGAAMQALGVAGGSASALSDGARYLAQTQKGDGGWTLAGGAVNSQSTAWAIQGLVAAHGSGSAISKGVSYLGKRQASNGSYSYSAASSQTPVWVTAQALTGVTRKAFPLAVVARAPARSGGPDGDGPGNGADGGMGGPGSPGASASSKNGGDKEGEDRGSGEDERDARGDETADGASVADVAADGPGTVDAEQAAAGDAQGLTDAAKIGIGGGVLAVLVAGGVVYYRRALA